MSKHTVVISVDAMVFEDLEYLITLPNFSRLLDGASVIERVSTIYPSVTHPVHATIITGAPAGVTGIPNNYIFDPADPENSREWYNRLSEIKCDTLLHAAKRGGFTVASATWPLVTECGDTVDHLVPGMLNYYFDDDERDPVSKYVLHGAGEEMRDIISKAIELYGYRDCHPNFEDFQTYCTAEIIKRFKPGLMLTHPSDVDSKRHGNGVFGEAVNASLRATDGWLGQILDAIEEAGMTEETDVIVLSDHGQINITRIISPNVFLADNGYIKLDENGRGASWEAYAFSTGASAQVYLSRPNDSELYNGVYKLLSKMADEGIYGFERVYTADEVKEKYGLYGDFSFALETDGYTSFGTSVTRPAVRPFDQSDYRSGRATHGHEPHKGAQPTFIAKGPSFKKDAVIPHGNILNHAPTIAAAMGIELRDAWGQPVWEILNIPRE